MSEPKAMTREEGMKKLIDLMKDVKFGMLTTVAEDSNLHSRPMTLQESEFDGILWFFTGLANTLAHEVVENPRVNVSFASDDNFVSVSGTAVLVNNEAKKKELWNPLYGVWFPEGVDDPNLVLLKVKAERAEYWDSHGRVTSLFGMIASMVTGKKIALGEHQTVEFK